MKKLRRRRHKKEHMTVKTEVDTALFGRDLLGSPIERLKKGAMAKAFLVPPFSVLNAREGWWQTRKRAWVSLGIKSEEGRKENLTYAGTAAAMFDHYRVKEGTRKSSDTSGTSVFDPVLCELVYRWFCPHGGQVVDPFAGGSVRGIIAAVLGMKYWGCDLQQKQVAANEKQAVQILGTEQTYGVGDVTPVQRINHKWLKRDDLCIVHGARGGKARTCETLARKATKGLTTAGSRSSPQVALVATMAANMGLPCVVNVPEGDISTGPVRQAQKMGAKVIQHRAGYNTVIIARSREYAKAHKYTEIPFGMMCEEAIEETSKQVVNLPRNAKRLVVPVGSGMTLSGVLWGLVDNEIDMPVLGVRVGANPRKRLDRYAPPNWREMVSFVDADEKYKEHVAANIGGIDLDPVYEAKCVKYLEDDDIFWVVGHRDPFVSTTKAQWVCGDAMDVVKTAPKADLIFTCPPYGDLERYSDDPRDISTMEYHTFLAAYKRIIHRAALRLKQDRFFAIVVGEFRDKRTGLYRNFVGETISACLEQGLGYYNEAVVLTSIGSLPIRAGNHFRVGRKLGKAHQNLLVFVKGDPKRAAKAIEKAKE